MYIVELHSTYIDKKFRNVKQINDSHVPMRNNNVDRVSYRVHKNGIQ